MIFNITIVFIIPLLVYISCKIFKINFEYDSKYEFHFEPSKGHGLTFFSLVIAIMISFNI